MSYYVNNYIKKIFESLALDTWVMLRDSLELDISISEETITDINLLNLKRKNFSEFVIWKCPKDQEANTGVDWEWFIGSNSVGWHRYAIQAKKLCLKGRYRGTYNKLYYKPKNKTQEQIELLENYAKVTNSIPIYCFYNYKDISIYSPQDYWLRKIWKCCSPDMDIQQLGCTVTPLEVVKEIINGKNKKYNTFEYIHDNDKTIPWRCLTACPNRQQLYSNPIVNSEYAITKYQQIGYYEAIPENRAILLNTVQSKSKETDDILYQIRGDSKLSSQKTGEVNTIPKRILKISVEE